MHILVEVREVFEVDRPAHPYQFLDNFEEFGVTFLVLVLVLATAEHEHHADFLGNASPLQFVDVMLHSILHPFYTCDGAVPMITHSFHE